MYNFGTGTGGLFKPGDIIKYALFWGAGYIDVLSGVLPAFPFFNTGVALSCWLGGCLGLAIYDGNLRTASQVLYGPMIPALVAGVATAFLGVPIGVTIGLAAWFYKETMLTSLTTPKS